MSFELKMRIILIFFVINSGFSIIPKNIKPVGNLLNDFGYAYEKHKVITEDEYILELERIPNKLNSNLSMKQIPVLFLHGLSGSCADFIVLGPKRALSLQLVDEGYDVWLLNCRGSYYTSHKYLKPNSSKFLNFSFHEIGIYDLPATIDYILDLTEQSTLFHIGHSQGTTAFFILLSEKPQYNSKIRASIAFAPSVFLCHSGPQMLRVLSYLESSGLLVTSLRSRVGDFNAAPFMPFLKNLCRPGTFIYQLCIGMAAQTYDITLENLEHEAFQLLLTYDPAGVSTKQLVHYLQLTSKCEFRQYQESINVIPKEYNLKNVEAPIYAFSGTNDMIQRTQDSLILEKHLPNGYKEFHLVTGLAHSDYLLSKTALIEVYPKTIEILNKL